MSSQDRDRAAITQLVAAWRAGWLAGDVHALLDLYCDEPILLPQGRPAVSGRDAIRSLYEPVMRDYDFQGESIVNEVDVSGDLGYLWSSYRMIATPRRGGERTEVAGKSIFILRRHHSAAWKIALLIDNSDSE